MNQQQPEGQSSDPTDRPDGGQEPSAEEFGPQGTWVAPPRPDAGPEGTRVAGLGSGAPLPPPGPAGGTPWGQSASDAEQPLSLDKQQDQPTGQLPSYGQPGGQQPAYGGQPDPYGQPGGYGQEQQGWGQQQQAWANQQPLGYSPAASAHPPITGPDDKGWALAAHLGTLILGFIAPLITLLVKPQSPYVRRHSVDSLNFQLSVMLYTVIAFVALIIITIVTLGIGALLFIPLGLAYLGVLVLVIVASVKAANGEVFDYPLTIPFIKP